MIYNLILFTLLSLTGIIVGLKQTKKYELSTDSTYAITELFLPKLTEHENLYYIALNIIISAIVFYFNFYKVPFCYNTAIEIIKAVTVIQSGIMLSMIDLKCFKIPNKYTVPLIITMFVLSLFKIQTFIPSILGATIAFILLLLIQIITNGGIGGGDTKLCTILGFLLGWKKIIYCIPIGFILGGFFALILLKSKLINKKDFIPYGIYFFVASILVYIIL